ncbi:MAG: Gfo/Idh/MocA family oxidoreductase [Fimbriimonadaceae bacterium]
MPNIPPKIPAEAPIKTANAYCIGPPFAARPPVPSRAGRSGGHSGRWTRPSPATQKRTNRQNGRMRVGILGLGGMGSTHLRQYRQMPDVEILAFDPKEERRQMAAAGGAVACTSPEDLIGKADVVDVCVATDLHHAVGMEAVAAGKAVFMEKPIARTLEQAAELMDAADKARVPFTVGMVVRYFPEFARANAVVRSGSLGNPAAARTRRGGAAPRGSQDWFMDHRRSGGVLVDLAIHDFDWLRWTLGEVKSLYARSVAAERGSGPDYALTTLTFDSGCVGHVEATWMDPAGFRVTFEVCGSDGMIQYDSRSTPTLRTNLAQPADAAANDPRAQSTGRSGGVESPLAAQDDPYYRELRAFLDAVRAGNPPPISPHDGAMALSIGLAALESARTGRAVTPARHF